MLKEVPPGPSIFLPLVSDHNSMKKKGKESEPDGRPEGNGEECGGWMWRRKSFGGFIYLVKQRGGCASQLILLLKGFPSSFFLTSPADHLHQPFLFFTLIVWGRSAVQNWCVCSSSIFTSSFILSPLVNCCICNARMHQLRNTPSKTRDTAHTAHTQHTHTNTHKHTHTHNPTPEKTTKKEATKWNHHRLSRRGFCLFVFRFVFLFFFGFLFSVVEIMYFSITSLFQSLEAVLHRWRSRAMQS